MSFISKILDWFRPTFKPKSEDTSELLELVNIHRGVHQLRLDPVLSRVAQAWADAMAGSGKLTHGDYIVRISNSGYPGFALAENIAFGQTTSAEVVKTWLASPEHKANMLNPVYKDVGFGRSGNYWVADFGGN